MWIILPISSLAVSPAPTNRVTSRGELSSFTPASRVDGAPHIARQGDRCTSDYRDNPPIEDGTRSQTLAHTKARWHCCQQARSS